LNANNSKISWEGWWRWPLIPIASILGAFLGSGAFMLIQWFSMKYSGNFYESGWYFQYIIPLMKDALFGFLVVYCGCSVAPRGKLIVGVVLTTLLASLFIWYFINPSEVITVSGIFSGVVVVVGGIAGVVQAYE